MMCSKVPKEAVKFLSLWWEMFDLKIVRRKTNSIIIKLKQVLFSIGQEDGHWQGPYLGFPKKGPRI